VAFLPIYSALAPSIRIGLELVGVVSALYSSATFWLALILIPVACLLRDVAWKYFYRLYYSEDYHIIQEFQKFNIPDYRPRMDQFKKAVHKLRVMQRHKRNRGFAFAQNETGEADLIRRYDTTKAKPRG
jgi:phospholipid-transporting ATPase